MIRTKSSGRERIYTCEYNVACGRETLIRGQVRGADEKKDMKPRRHIIPSSKDKDKGPRHHS